MILTDPVVLDSNAAYEAAELREAEDGITAEQAHYDVAGPNPGHAWVSTGRHTFPSDPWQTGAPTTPPWGDTA